MPPPFATSNCPARQAAAPFFREAMTRKSPRPSAKEGPRARLERFVSALRLEVFPCFKFLEVLLKAPKPRRDDKPSVRLVPRMRENYFNTLGIREARPPVDTGNSAIALLDSVAQGGPSLKEKDVRQVYLQKLAYNKVWVPTTRRPARYQAVIILDWDDTLLCSTYLSQRRDMPRTAAFCRQLRRLEQAALNLLELAMQAGRVMIITNAIHGWVQQSAKEYLPNLAPVLKKVEVISAQALYGDMFPNDVGQWKIRTFLDLQRGLPQILTNLIAVGDSEFEMDAARIMGRHFVEGLTKMVKLREDPAPEELTKDLEFLTKNFTSVIESTQDLRLEVKHKSLWAAALERPRGPSAPPRARPTR